MSPGKAKDTHEMVCAIALYTMAKEPLSEKDFDSKDLDKLDSKGYIHISSKGEVTLRKKHYKQLLESWLPVQKLIPLEFSHYERYKHDDNLLTQQLGKWLDSVT